MESFRLMEEISIEFSEREATLPYIAGKIKSDLGTEEEVVLCDGKGNRMIEGAGTTGMLL